MDSKKKKVQLEQLKDEEANIKKHHLFYEDNFLNNQAWLEQLTISKSKPARYHTIKKSYVEQIQNMIEVEDYECNNYDYNKEGQNDNSSLNKDLMQIQNIEQEDGFYLNKQSHRIEKDEVIIEDSKVVIFEAKEKNNLLEAKIILMKDQILELLKNVDEYRDQQNNPLFDPDDKQGNERPSLERRFVDLFSQLYNRSVKISSNSPCLSKSEGNVIIKTEEKMDEQSENSPKLSFQPVVDKQKCFKQLSKLHKTAFSYQQIWKSKKDLDDALQYMLDEFEQKQNKQPGFNQSKPKLTHSTSFQEPQKEDNTHINKNRLSLDQLWERPKFKDEQMLEKQGNIFNFLNKKVEKKMRKHQYSRDTIKNPNGNEVRENNQANENIEQNHNNENNENLAQALMANPQNQENDISFQLQQTMTYISSLRYRLDLRIQAIRSLNSNLSQKITFKKILLVLYYFPLCVGFIVLLIRNGLEFCNLNVFIHLCIYTTLSLRNFIVNVYVYRKCRQHFSILHFYESNVLSHDTFYCILSDLQAQYKKQQDLQQKIEQNARVGFQQQIQPINNEPNQLNNNYMQANVALQNNSIQQQNQQALLQIQSVIPDQNFLMMIAAIQSFQNQQPHKPNNESSHIQDPNINHHPNNNASINNQISNNNQNNLSNNNNDNNNSNNSHVINNNNVINNNPQNMSSSSHQQSHTISNNLNNNNAHLSSNKQDDKQDMVASNNFYLIQFFSLIIHTLNDSNTLKLILANSPNIRDNKQSYNMYQMFLLENLKLKNYQLKETDLLIEHNQQMLYQVNTSLIQREIENAIKYKNKQRLSKFMRIYTFFEDHYLVVYNLFEFTFTYCYSSEINSFIVFSFYYSAINWLQIVIITFSLAFMLLALIFYFFFQILTCKRKKKLKTFQLKDVKNMLMSTKKYTEQEMAELCCIICLVEFEEKDDVFLSECCKRCFHKSCILEWFKVNQKCPMCRASVSP